ncbi:MAG: response regulator, partial [Planctomycetes bacterium]|nr:response regulator [Planctomycetota bacterium]
ITEKEILTIQQEATEKTKQLTEQIQLAQKQLIQSEKLSIIGQLIAGIAHELNNPLTTISGFSQLALEQKKPEKNMSYLEKIHTESMRCERIVKQLLIFARKHISEKSYVNINDIIQSIVNLKNYEWTVNKIEVTLNLDKKLHPTMADEFQLQQALLNIVLNAEQALSGFSQSGKLLIETSQEGTDILIKITDNGPGIPPEMHKTIFEPFFTTKPIGEGTGLGLSLCTNIVKDHNGEISVKSTPGKGATFIIKLPIAPKTDTSEIRKKRKSEHINRNVKGKKVIVIDDEMHITELMREILSQSGIVVCTAYDGNSGLEKLKKEKYDMVICDIKMPAFSGIELHHELTKINPKLAREVLYLTGDIFSKETQEFINKTGVQTLQKPFNITEFKNIVLSHLSTH